MAWLGLQPTSAWRRLPCPSHNPVLAPGRTAPGDALSEAPGPQRTRQVLYGLLLEFPVVPWLGIVYPNYTEADSSLAHFY